jgi:hypothetical protein
VREKQMRVFGVDGKILLKLVLRKMTGVDRIDLAYNGEMWPLFVKEVMEVRVPYNAGKP